MAVLLFLIDLDFVVDSVVFDVPDMLEKTQEQFMRKIKLLSSELKANEKE